MVFEIISFVDDVDVTKSQNLDPTGDQSKELFHARCKINHLDIVVRREYAKFTTDLLSLLERKGVSVNDAIFQFVQLDMGVLTNDMRGATDNRAFLIALKHTQSWYDFNITASLAESLGGDEGAELVRAYETKLKSNLQKRRKVFKLVNTKKLVIKFNEKREHFTKEKREDFEAIIVRLMNVKDKKKELVLKSIRDGCVEVTYLFPSTLAPAIKSTIVSELNDHKVISMSIDG